MPSPQHSLPFSDPEAPSVSGIAAPPAVPRPPRTWHFWGTTIFGTGAYVVQMIAQVATFVVLVGAGIVPLGTAEEMQAVMLNGGWLALAITAACPLVLVALWIPVRIARQRFSDYLALCWPSRGEVISGLAMLAAFILAWVLLRLALGQTTPAFMTETYGSARASGALALGAYVFAFCVAAPIAEEFLFRGFVLRGWSQSFLGPTGAVVLSSVVWAALHTQYNLFYMARIFTLGILLGTLRQRSGSTWLTVILHAVHNLVSIAQVAFFVSIV